MQIDMVYLVTLGTKVIAGSSVLHSILPPWEAFGDFPRIQKVYKLFVYLVGYVAINWRSTLWKDLSTHEGSEPSKVANGVNGSTH